MAIDKHITLERLIQYKTRQDQFNANNFLGVHATADKTAVLANTRTIDGVNFNGSTNITLPTKIIHIYSDNGTFYTDSAKTIAFTSSSYPNLTDKLFIDDTTGKSAYWDGNVLRYIEAADTTPYIASSEKGAVNGVAQLDNSGKVVADQLPDFVDDVVEVEAADIVDNKIVLYSDTGKTQAVTGEVDKIYVDVNAVIDGTYRWGGSELGFIKVGSNVTSAVSATRATQDGNGDVIDTTYVKAESGKGLMSDEQAEQLESLLQTQSAKEYAVDDDIVNLFKIKTAPSVSSESNLTYDGTPLNPVLDGYDGNKIDLTGTTSATNAGTYTLYATPKAGYTWDSTTGYSGMQSVPVQWSIGKADPTVTLSKNSLELDSNTLSDTFTFTYNGDGNLSVSSSDNNVATCSRDGNTVTVTAIDNGTCSINIVASSGNNYNAVSGVSISVEVDLRPIIVLTDSNYKMYDIYPDTYYSMTTIPDKLNTSNVTTMEDMFGFLDTYWNSMSGCTNLTSVPRLNTSNVINMNGMFNGCSSLTTIPQLDTSNVTNMSNMFADCSSLTTIPQLNTSNVTEMGHMFEGCANLTTVPQLNTSNVTDMEGMFNYCTNLTTIPQLDTSNVTDMSSMINYCRSLTTIPQLNTSKVTDMNNMFSGCSSLTTIPQLNTSNVTDMYGMFSGCTSLTTIPQLNTSNVTDMHSMFYNCANLTTIPQLDTSNITDMSYMFGGCTNLTTIPQLNTSNVTNMQYMFRGCTSLPSTFPWTIDCSSIGNVNSVGSTSKYTWMRDMFKGSSVTNVTLANVSDSDKSEVTSQLLKGDNTLTINFVNIPNYHMSTIYPSTYQTMTSADINTIKTQYPGILDNLTSTANMFNDCNKLTTINNLDKLDTSNVTYTMTMFKNCTSLTSIPQLNTSNVINMNSMFNGCSSLTSIPQLNTSKVTSMINMFYNCANLTTVPQLDTSKVTDMSYMFGGCTNLTTILQLNTSNVTDMQSMFKGCTSLTTIPQLNTSNVTNMESMFRGCTSLPSTFPWTIDCSNISNGYSVEYMFKDSSVTNVTLTNVSDSIRSSVTSSLLKGDNTLTINFV